METIIIIRYAEIHLKGKNRGFFERIFSANLEKSLRGIRHELHRMSGRYLVAKFDEARTEEICAKIKNVFGLHSYSVGYLVESDLTKIAEAALLVAPESGTFKVESHRGNKRFPLTSIELSREIGARILEKRRLTVDVHNPERTVYLDVRENGVTLVFSAFEHGMGGMPVGSAGKGLLLVSGGIDSPVAGYMMAKRGLLVEFLHFHSYPYTNDGAKEKVRDLCKILSSYGLSCRLHTVSVTKIQEEIHEKCAPELNITLLRRFMFRIGEKMAQKLKAKCLITGESLGQVASQTVEGLTSSNAVIERLPVLRPLIGFDKEEIVALAKKIGTYETSVLPYEDCCTVFLPEFPATHPRLPFVEAEEKKLDIAGLIEESLATEEVLEWGGKEENRGKTV